MAAVVLAAGGSTRLGRPKQLVAWGSTTLLEHVLGNVRSWRIGSIVVVLGRAAADIEETVDLTGTEVVVNPEWKSGMATSIRVGLTALVDRPAVEAALIVLADQPDVPATAVDAVLDRAAASPAPVVAPRYRGVRSNPVLVRRPMWDAFTTLSGDTGARSLLDAHPGWVDHVDLDLDPPRDIDTVDDLTGPGEVSG